MNPSFRPQSCTRWISLTLALVCFGQAPTACAGDVSLTVSVSPEMAYQVREWRREHGLPQAPEASPSAARNTGKRVALSDGNRATQKALRLLGLDGAAPDDLQVSTRHEGTHWQVTVKVLGDAAGAAQVIDVADSLAAGALPHAP